MSATHAVSALSRGPRRPVGDLIARISEKATRLLNPNWLPFRSNDPTDELIVEHHGPVEIHQTHACWSLETRVKGEPDRARATAVRRLGNYANGKNRSHRPPSRTGLAVHPLGARHHRLGAQLRDDRGEVLEVINLEIDG